MEEQMSQTLDAAEKAQTLYHILIRNPIRIQRHLLKNAVQPYGLGVNSA